MVKVVTAYEAAALLNAHPGMSPHNLYERLTGDPQPKGAIGLTTYLSDGAIRFAESEYQWSRPVQRKASMKVFDFEAEARLIETSDDRGPLAVVFLHIDNYLHTVAWQKAGVPPIAYVYQANWTMWLAKAQRLAFLVLADKRIVLYEVQRDEAIIEALIDGLEQMSRRIAENDPPPIDTPAGPSLHHDSDASDYDLDELVARWRQMMCSKALSSDSAAFASQAAEAAATKLKAALAPGKSHESDGVRVFHNAKSGRLTVEKIDGKYF